MLAVCCQMMLFTLYLLLFFQNKPFWIICRALKEFVKNEGNGRCNVRMLSLQCEGCGGVHDVSMLCVNSEWVEHGSGLTGFVMVWHWRI